MKRVLIGVLTAALIPALLAVGFLAGVFYRPALTEADMERLYREAAEAMAEWDAHTCDVIVDEGAAGLRYARINGRVSLPSEIEQPDLDAYDDYAESIRARLAACMARQEHGRVQQNYAHWEAFFAELPADCYRGYFSEEAYTRAYVSIEFEEGALVRCSLLLENEEMCREYCFGTIDYGVQFG